MWWEHLLLALMVALAAFYLLRVVFGKKGCGCGGSSCSSEKEAPAQESCNCNDGKGNCHK